ncbi:MarR family transcriptional regulator [Pseudoflavonifractor sp. DSM 107456]|uniref:MarR family transcriptional regulator n=2 Tax=Pseudoflavonifractor TaxID=1017280 RepID=A0ABR9R8A0_9FIRM|nr:MULTISPECIES: MarR family transcriptional regulator [Eubacteriales]MBC5729616.1 MarR family transcriptional regulator [Pseudoflavonifractor hominis]MBE5054919.1 MarR family transcriptional regulator [Pseudoflavonifractor gallinarum]
MQLEQKEIGYLLKQITEKIKVDADSSLKARNLTLSQVRVLECVFAAGGSATQKFIEESLDVSHPTVVGLITRMEKNGYLHCYVDERDKRNKIAALTPRAEAAFVEIRHDIASLEEKLVKGMDARSRSELHRLLEQIYHNLT